MKLLLAVVTTLALAVPAAAQQTIFVVRHAERADASPGAAPAMAADPDLSEKGKARAQALATMLKDTKISAIYTTQYKRTVQTAAPLAKALAIEPTVIDARETASLIEKLKAGGNALVVAHSNTVGAILQQLGVADSISLGDEDYDNIFIVVRSEKPTLIRLHFR